MPASDASTPQAPPALLWQRRHDKAILPEYQTSGAAGFDLHSVEEGVLAPGGWALFDTGWSVAIPEGYEMQVRPRSGLAARYGVTVLNSPGTIDSDYRGPLKAVLINHGPTPYTVKIGERIAQAVIAPVSRLAFQELPVLPESVRGHGGFGSTGK